MNVSQHEMENVDRTIVVSRSITNQAKSLKKYTYYKKNGHMVDYCWDLHLENKNIRNKENKKTRGHSHQDKKNMNKGGNTSSGLGMIEEKRKWVENLIKNLQAYLGHLHDEYNVNTLEVNQTLVAQSDKGKTSNSE